MSRIREELTNWSITMAIIALAMFAYMGLQVVFDKAAYWWYIVTCPISRRV